MADTHSQRRRSLGKPFYWQIFAERCMLYTMVYFHISDSEKIDQEKALSKKLSLGLGAGLHPPLASAGGPFGTAFFA
jgi:hypothetical protein